MGSFVIAGDKASVQRWNIDVKKLGYGSTEDMGNEEVRLKLISGRWWLVINDSSVEKKIGELTASEVLDLLKTVDGSGSGLDADLLDGQDISFFRNASNLNNGTVSRARLGDCWEDTNGQNTYPFIQSGDSAFTGAAIYYPQAYTVAPRIVTSTPSNSSHAVPHIWGEDTTKFYGKAKTMDTQQVVSLSSVHWVAVGKRV